MRLVLGFDAISQLRIFGGKNLDDLIGGASAPPWARMRENDNISELVFMHARTPPPRRRGCCPRYELGGSRSPDQRVFFILIERANGVACIFAPIGLYGDSVEI